MQSQILAYCSQYVLYFKMCVLWQGLIWAEYVTCIVLFFRFCITLKINHLHVIYLDRSHELVTVENRHTLQDDSDFVWHTLVLPCNTWCRYLHRGIFCLSHKQTLCCLPNTVTAVKKEAIFLTCLKCKWTCLRGIQKKKKILPACLWEGGVTDNTKNTKYEDVQKQTPCVLQMHSWGSR